MTDTRDYLTVRRLHPDNADRERAGGISEDTVRLIWLAANAIKMSGRGGTGVYMLDGVPPFESGRKECTLEDLRKAIDKAMQDEVENAG